MRFVLDGSTALRWCLVNQQTVESSLILKLMTSSEAVVPAVWPLEIANVVSRELNKKTIALDDALNFLTLLSAFKITVVAGYADALRIFNSARLHSLSAYDATYVDLALELKLPLVSQDARMRSAAELAGIPLLV